MAKDPTIKVRNWGRWQSYRSDRGQPPWIKVHRALMRDPNWVALSDAMRGQLVAIWLLAADRDGVIPTSASLIKKLCFMDSEPDLNMLKDKGFLDGDIPTPERRQPDANMTAQSRVEKSRVEERRVESEDLTPGRRQDDANRGKSPQASSPPIPDFSDMLDSVEEAKGEPESGYVTLTDEDRELAGREMRRLNAAVRQLNPKATIRENLSSVDEMLRIRGRGYEWDEVKAMIKWATSDSFWQSKILSPRDLNKHFDKLVAAKNSTDGTEQERRGKAAMAEFLAMDGKEGATP